MSTSQTPETSEQVIPPETTETPMVPPESTSETTPQITSPTAPPTNPRYVEILETTLREQNARIQALQDQINRPPAQPSAAPASAEEARANFYNDPVKSVREIIQAELKEAVEPLVSFTRGLTGVGTPYDRLKSQFKSDARYRDMFSDPNFELAVDHVMARAELKPEVMQNAIINIAGLKAVGQLEAALIAQGITPTRPTTTPPVAPSMPTPTPPHVRPTPTPAPAPPAPTQRRALTENELRLARERGMTPDQYLDWIDVRPEHVVTSKIGRNG